MDASLSQPGKRGKQAEARKPQSCGRARPQMLRLLRHRINRMRTRPQGVTLCSPARRARTVRKVEFESRKDGTRQLPRNSALRAVFKPAVVEAIRNSPSLWLTGRTRRIA